MIIDRLSTNEVSFIEYAGSGLIAKVKVTAWCVLTYTQVFSRGERLLDDHGIVWPLFTTRA